MRRFLIFLAGVHKWFKRCSLRLRGMTEADLSRARILQGRTWDDFCDTLKAAGANVLSHGDADDRTKAEGYRYLSRLIRGGLEAFVEYADPEAPVLRRMVHETVKMGADNPDNFYENAVVRGDLDYRITGTRGTVHFLTFSTQKGGYGKGGGLPPTGFLDSRRLIVDADGCLDIIVSATPHEGNWLPMEKDTGMLMVRQTFLHRDKEEPARLTIAPVSAVAPPSPADCRRVDEGLMNAANLVAGASFLFSKWTRDFRAGENRLPRFDPATSTAAGGDPDIAYYHSFWRLAPDEALVIEVTPPDCEHWNFQLNNYWMESLDYRYHRIHINKGTAVVDRDGRVTVVVAHEDPGHPNWLCTTRLPMGTMCWRWIRATSHPTPATRVVRLAQLQATIAHP